MTPKAIGLYVHIPFCVRKCNYCDFCSYPLCNLEGDKRENYIDTLIREIASYKRDVRIAIDTIFFGGGTPSLLLPVELGKILRAISDSFEILPGAEITLEANPGTLNREKLIAYKDFGINRLSVGLQSIHENELKKLGRIHNYSNFIESYRLAREVGFDNISVDVMYGIPDQTPRSFAKTLDTVTALAPEHISAYGLIIEEGTPFFVSRDALELPTEDSECDMYELACDKLRAAGYAHYEISNYAKPGRESRHNLHYWRADEYIGVGVAAYSYYDGMRYSNPESIDEYFRLPAVDKTPPDDFSFEYAMLALRLREGLSLSEYEKLFLHSFLDGRDEKIRQFIALGYMTTQADRLALTERGFYVSNAILSDLL